MDYSSHKMGRFNEFLQIPIIKGEVNLLPMFLQKSFAIAKTRQRWRPTQLWIKLPIYHGYKNAEENMYEAEISNFRPNFISDLSR